MHHRTTAPRRLAACLALTAAAASLAPAFHADADVQLASVFGDRMVLQRGEPIRVWGTAEPGSTVTVTLTGVERWGTDDALELQRSASATADDAGRFLATLDAIAPEDIGTYTLTAQQHGIDHAVELTDVLLGEVWVCSGQSNMAWGVRQSNNADAEIAAADHPGIRLIELPTVASREPVQTTNASWTACSPDTIADFSAVGYYFGRALYEALDCPIGLIDSNWGGTPAESWIPLDAVAGNPVTAPIVERSTASWDAPNRPTTHADPGNTGLDKGYADADFNHRNWLTRQLPATYEAAFNPQQDGVVWFRRTIDLPAELRGQPLTLSLGPIDDTDTTYVNGTAVGSTGRWDTHRVYQVPATLTDTDSLTLTVRCFDSSGVGGFSGAAELMSLAPTDGANAENTLRLNGPWHAHVEHNLSSADLGARAGLTPQHRAASLFRGMIEPLTPMTIAGTIWYQGESNASRAEQYRTLMPMLIQQWRTRFVTPDGSPPAETPDDFPFGIVELANFRAPVDTPADSDWAELREAQQLAAQTLPNVGCISIIDVGNANDIHPRDKQTVGQRLANWALATHYGHDHLVWTGPTLAGASFADGVATLTLDLHGAESLATRGDDAPIRGFQIAGDDRVFHWADATGGEHPNVLHLRSDAVDAPVAVRYAWATNPTDGPHGANLTNNLGLPTPPFRTDDWPLSTAGRY